MAAILLKRQFSHSLRGFSRPLASVNHWNLRRFSASTALSKDLLKDIDFIVCDMAGTTVEEGGLVYSTLQKVMNESELALGVSDAAMHPWHGAKKEAVLENFLRAKYPDMAEEDVENHIHTLGDKFLEEVTAVYFSEGSPLAPIHPTLFEFLDTLRNQHGIKIGLDTGYPPEIQQLLLNALGLGNHVDDYISSYQVPSGRPYPYMIHQLMERQGIMDTRRVAKVGDSCRDMEEGRNAGCGLVVGVLSGADNAEQLFAAGAHIVIDVVTDLPYPPTDLKC